MEEGLDRPECVANDHACGFRNAVIGANQPAESFPEFWHVEFGGGGVEGDGATRGRESVWEESVEMGDDAGVRFGAM